MNDRALILVDLQNDYFPAGKWELVGIGEAAANAALVLAAARATSDRVVHVRHENPSPEAPFFVPGSEGAEIHGSVAPATGEPVVVKNFPNSFRDTDLHSILERDGVREVVIVGAMSHMCIDATARAATDLGYGVTVVHDACATRDLAFGGTVIPAAQVHGAFMAALAFGYAQVVSAAECPFSSGPR